MHNGPVRFIFKGDPSIGKKYTRIARKYIGVWNSFSKAPRWRRVLPDGAKIELIRLDNNNNYTAIIDVKGVVEGINRYRGFVSIPISEVSTIGWGEPFTEENSPIGTTGGTNPEVIFSTQQNYRTIRADEYISDFPDGLKYGIIDWQGSGEEVLSWGGSSRRYRTVSPDSSNVYRNGKIWADVPNDVVGAAIFVENRIRYLIVATLAYPNIIFYIRKFKEEYSNNNDYSEINPYGWRELESFDYSGPGGGMSQGIFFNYSGKEAITIKSSYVTTYSISSSNISENIGEYTRLDVYKVDEGTHVQTINVSGSSDDYVRNSSAVSNGTSSVIFAVDYQRNSYVKGELFYNDSFSSDSTKTHSEETVGFDIITTENVSGSSSASSSVILNYGNRTFTLYSKSTSTTEGLGSVYNEGDTTYDNASGGNSGRYLYSNSYRVINIDLRYDLVFLWKDTSVNFSGSDSLSYSLIGADKASVNIDTISAYTFSENEAFLYLYGRETTWITEIPLIETPSGFSHSIGDVNTGSGFSASSVTTTAWDINLQTYFTDESVSYFNPERSFLMSYARNRVDKLFLSSVAEIPDEDALYYNYTSANFNPVTQSQIPGEDVRFNTIGII